MDSNYPFGIFKLFLFSFSKHLLLFKEFKINKDRWYLSQKIENELSPGNEIVDHIGTDGTFDFFIGIIMIVQT
jgi:hypothetical protein